MSSLLLNPSNPFKLESVAGHDDGASIVCIIFDINPQSWRQCFDSASVNLHYEKTIDTICVFLRAMLLTRWPVSLDLSVICTAPGAPFVFQSHEAAPSLKIDQLPREIGPRVRRGLIEATEQAQRQVYGNRKVCSITGALSRALCYIRQRRKAFASALVRRSQGSVDARVLCIHVENTDNYAEYIPFMNAVFAAQKENIFIDSIALSSVVAQPPGPYDEGKLPSLFSQASRMTRGLYSVVLPDELLENLLCKYHTGARGRLSLRLPGDFGGDGDPKYRERGSIAAICFCHKRPITRGFVCSVCLTVLCSFNALCQTCGSRFIMDLAALPVTRPPPPAIQRPELPPEEEDKAVGSQPGGGKQQPMMDDDDDDDYL